MSGSRQRTTTTLSRHDGPLLWKSDSDQPRRTMATTQRHNIDPTASTDEYRRHYSSNTPNAAGMLGFPEHDGVQHKSSTKQQSSAAAPIAPPYKPAQSQNYATWNAAPASTSRSRTYDASFSGDVRTDGRRKAHRHNPRSLNEYTALLEEGKHSRPSEQSRSAAAPAQAPAPTHTHWMGPAETARDLDASSKRYRDRDTDREADQQRRREEKERERQRQKDAEKQRERERDRERRGEREKERDRSSKDKDIEREERSRAYDSRRRQERRTVERENAPVFQAYTPSSPAAQHRPYADDRPSAATIGRHAGRAGQYQIVPPADLNQSAHTTVRTEPAGHVHARRPSDSSLAPQAVPIHSSDHDKNSVRHHRLRRDRGNGQQSGQDSGMSSSEQEPSGRERYRSADRRHAIREQHGDGRPSGHSGSDTERGSMRERRNASRAYGATSGQSKVLASSEPVGHSATAETYASASQQETYSHPTRQSSRNRESPLQRPGTAQLPTYGTQTHTPVGPYGQASIPVGSPVQRDTAQIVSIRAGQGPADVQTPALIPKSSSTGAVNRVHIPAHAERPAPQAATPHAQQLAGQNPLAQLGGPPGTSSSAQVNGRHDAAKRSHTSNAGAQQAAVPIQPTPASSANPQDSASSTSFLHPVQRAIRSVEGILRPAVTAHHRRHDTYPVVSDVRQATTSQRSRSLDQQPGYMRSTATDQRHESRAHAHTKRPYAVPNNSSPAIVEASLQSPTPPRRPSLDTQQSPPLSAMVPLELANANGSATSVNPPGPNVARAQLDDGAAVQSLQPADVTVQYATSTVPSQKDDVRSPKSPAILPSGPQVVTVAQTTFETTPAQPSPLRTMYAPAQKAAGSVAEVGVDSKAERPYQSPARQPNPMPIISFDQPINTSGYSPAQYAQANLTRSPASANAPPLNSTPRQSSSARLYHRNGSNDTIPHSAGQNGPFPANSSQQSLTYQSNAQANAPLRTDTNPTARPSNVSTGYPDNTRYRSPAPAAYPPPTNTSSEKYLFAPAVPVPTQSSRPTAPTGAPTASHEHAAHAPRYMAESGAPPHQAGAYRTVHSSTTEPSIRFQDMAPGQRMPSRTAPSPAPSVSARQYQSVSTAPKGTPGSPVPSRKNVSSASAPRRPDPTPPVPSVHSRTASDPYHSSSRGRTGISGYSGHVKSRSDSRAMSNNTLDQDALRTPSSLTPSVLPRQSSHAPNAATLTRHVSREKETSAKDKDKISRKPSVLSRFFGRSRSTPPKETEHLGTSEPAPAARRGRKESAPAGSVAVNPVAREAQDYISVQTMRVNVSEQLKANAPGPEVHAQVASGKGPASRMFTPFRLLSKRHHTVSAASMEATDGTTAPTSTIITGADSTRSSTVGRQSPPLPKHDPLAAAEKWRNNEEEGQKERGRRPRPGVTFETDPEANSAKTTTRPKVTRRPPPKE